MSPCVMKVKDMKKATWKKHIQSVMQWNRLLGMFYFLFSNGTAGDLDVEMKMASFLREKRGKTKHIYFVYFGIVEVSREERIKTHHQIDEAQSAFYVFH